MKKIFLFFLCIGSISKGSAQNLVPNSSFEVLDSCPSIDGKLYFAYPWFQPCVYYGNTKNSSSSDVCTNCATWAGMGVPSNANGEQLARTGNGYAGIYPEAGSFLYREYLEVPLLFPLIANKLYCVSFYISLAESSGHAISNLGAYFSNDSILDASNYHPIDYVIPQVENPDNVFLNDTANWTLVWGDFIAHGGERFMTIGDFHDSAHTYIQNVNGGIGYWSYYYIDDISVVDCDSTSGIEEIDNAMVSISPNPATEKLTVNSGQLTVEEIKINNVLGEVVYSTTKINPKTEIDISSLPKGIYFVRLITPDKIINRKFVKE